MVPPYFFFQSSSPAAAGNDRRTTMERTPAVELRNITKAFGIVVANKNVDLSVYYGEILSPPLDYQLDLYLDLKHIILHHSFALLIFERHQ